MKDRPNMRFLFRLGRVHQMQHLLQVRRLAGRTEIASDLVVEAHEPNAVLLLQGHVCQCRRNVAGILQLRHAIRLVAHGLRNVQQQVGNQIGFFFELFQVPFVGAAPDLPIHVADVVPWRVLTMFGEFDAKTVIRALVQTGNVSFNDQPGLQS